MLTLFKTYLRPYWKQIVLVLVLLLVQAITNLYLPNLNADIINNGVSKGDTAYIMGKGGVMLGITLLMGIAAIISVYWGSKTAMAFGRDLRAAIFAKVQTFSQQEVNIFGAPSLITRNTNDVQQLQMMVVFSLNMIIMAPITVVGGVIMALREDVPLSGILVVIIPFMAIVIGILASRAVPLFKAMQVKIDRVNQVMREKLSGIRVIRAFVRTGRSASTRRTVTSPTRR
jgi:ATP-binding cassette subfamily B multidrug efflux pump